MLWRSCIDMYLDHPVGGIGLGNFQKIYENRYRYPDETEHLSHAHNNFMHLLAETGTFGAVGYIGFVLYFLFTSFKSWRRHQDPYDILVFTTVLSFMGLFGQIEYIIDNSSAVRIFWFLLAGFITNETI
ncbi:MAG: O-antigen ligase family protein [Megasphaera cerevisiae]|nr:O-antigen ligase family protein [Megasphaera cerevisiae]